MCDCLINDRRRYVARTFSDRCAFVGHQESSVYMEFLSAAASGDYDHDLYLCRNGAAIHAVLESSTDHFDLGAKSRRTFAGAPVDRRGGGTTRNLESAAVRAIYALYSDPDAAQDAVNLLRRQRVQDRSITVITSQPYEEYEFSHRYKQTWIFWIAAGGGALGLCIGLTLAYLTETLWPIITGGMPIVAWWPNIIIMFELTMLGAILATVVSLLVTTELPSTQSRVYDSEVSQGKIMVAVEEPSDVDVGRLERTFRATGIHEVKRVG